MRARDSLVELNRLLSSLRQLLHRLVMQLLLALVPVPVLLLVLVFSGSALAISVS